MPIHKLKERQDLSFLLPNNEQPCVPRRPRDSTHPAKGSASPPLAPTPRLALLTTPPAVSQLFSPPATPPLPCRSFFRRSPPLMPFALNSPAPLVKSTPPLRCQRERPPQCRGAASTPLPPPPEGNPPTPQRRRDDSTPTQAGKWTGARYTEAIWRAAEALTCLPFTQNCLMFIPAIYLNIRNSQS